MPVDTPLCLLRQLRQLRLAAGRFALTLCVATAPIATATASTLAEVYDRARSEDPTLAAADAARVAVGEGVPLARASLMPQVNASGNTDDVARTFPQSQRPGENFNQFGWNATLRQPLLNVSGWFSLSSAMASRNQAEAQFAAAEQDLVVRVVRAYLDVLRASDLLESTEAEVAAVQRQLEQIQQRFDVGLVAITDVLDSQATYDNTVVRQIQAEGDHDIFFETLRTLTNEDYQSIARFSASLPIDPPDPVDELAWVEVALQNNLDVSAAEYAMQAATRSVRAARANRLPTVDVVVSFNHNTQGGANFFNLGGGNAKTRIDVTTYALQASVPIYQGGQIGANVRQSRARRDEAHYNLQAQIRRVDRDVRNLIQAVKTDVTRVAARGKAIRSAESALEATETGYQVGTRNIVDVLQAQQRLFATQFDYADSRYQYVLDHILLKQAAGVLSADDVYALNRFISAEDAVEQITPPQR